VTTWRAADVDTVVKVIRTFAGWPWPIPQDEVPHLLEALGWEPRPGNPQLLQANLGVDAGPAMVIGGFTETEAIDFAVTDVNPDDDAAVKRSFLQDVFADFAAAFRQEWGKPIKVVDGARPELWWAVDSSSAVQLVQTPLAVKTRFHTPEGVRSWRQVGEL
jgi:hypothetical protein